MLELLIIIVHIPKFSYGLQEIIDKGPKVIGSYDLERSRQTNTNYNDYLHMKCNIN